jgi:hypothetical protein
MTDAVLPVYNTNGNLLGVRFHPLPKGKELESAKVKFFETLKSAINEEEKN